MQYDRIVVGYHGCDEAFARAVLHGRKRLRRSVNDYDWLGHGVYFWEYGAQRAYEWAERKAARGQIRKPAVIGALIQLGACYDLLDTRFTTELRHGSRAFKLALKAQGWPVPKNLGRKPDRLLRHLDCAVLNWYLKQAESLGRRYQTVRCAFTEGRPIFRGAGMRLRNHIQIAVRDSACVIGIFRPTFAKEA
jgi:hypothetical protein